MHIKTYHSMRTNNSESHTIIEDGSFDSRQRSSSRDVTGLITTQNENSSSVYSARRAKKEDKIPFTPEVRSFICH